tara:strand:+ start:462 stop:713 length:252 start_codon:yes stop_codon:yes gene_type:complete
MPNEKKQTAQQKRDAAHAVKMKTQAEGDALSLDRAEIEKEGRDGTTRLRSCSVSDLAFYKRQGYKEVSAPKKPGRPPKAPEGE